MGAVELEQLCALLESVLHDKQIMEGLSVLEQQEIAGASETICSLIRKHLKPADQGHESSRDQP
jgi:hypothetical protein